MTDHEAIKVLAAALISVIDNGLMSVNRHLAQEVLEDLNLILLEPALGT
mgnify:CR=1 FL=1